MSSASSSASIVLVYITQGGFTAVVWFDVFQGTLMLVGLVAPPLLALNVGGGITPIMDTLRTSYLDHLTLTAGAGWNALTIASVIGLLAIGIGFVGSPQVFVRFISRRSEKEIPKGTVLAMVWTLLADSSVGRALLGRQAAVLNRYPALRFPFGVRPEVDFAAVLPGEANHLVRRGSAHRRSAAATHAITRFFSMPSR